MTLHGEAFENDGPSSATTTAPVRESKETLRHRALSRRKRTTADERMAAGDALALHFPLPLLGADPATMSVAAYVSMGTEVETRPLLTLLLDRGCTVMVPRLGSGRDIGWSVLTDVAMLRAVDQPGHLRPDEPTGRILPPDALRQCGLVIAPALGVDPRGYRLGRGAGWYDRALALRRPDCPLIAVCWPWEVMGEPLPTENHDVPADAVLTPEGYRRLRR